MTRITKRSAAGQRAQPLLVGTWRLVSLEQAGRDGSLEKADCTGQFVFTADGHAGVQVMYRNAGAAETGSTRYAEGGYEATFGRYTVDDRTHTFTFHVEGAIVRNLVGQDLQRTYRLTGDQLIVEPANKHEQWRVVWARE
jgi:hypothetical protein